MSIKIIIFVLIFISAVIFDFMTEYKNCIIESPGSIPILIFHRLINIALYFGWLLFDIKFIPEIYIFFVISVMAQWRILNNNCILTLKTNEICNFEKSRKFDYLSRYGGSNGDNIVYIICFCNIIYAIYTIYNKNIKLNYV
jgi:hypothetical protein